MSDLVILVNYSLLTAKATRTICVALTCFISESFTKTHWNFNITMRYYLTYKMLVRSLFLSNVLLFNSISLPYFRYLGIVLIHPELFTCPDFFRHVLSLLSGIMEHILPKIGWCRMCKIRAFVLMHSLNDQLIAQVTLIDL